MGNRGISVETVIAADLERVWAATEDPTPHVRWDVRFSEILPERDADEHAVRFTHVRQPPCTTSTAPA